MREYGMNALSPVEVCDPYWKDVVFLLAPKGGQIIDYKEHALSVFGNTTIRNDSVLFAGNGDYITSSYSDDFNLSSTPFTLDTIIVPYAFTDGNMQLLQKDGVSGSSYQQYGVSISSAKKVSCWLGNGTGTSNPGSETLGTSILSQYSQYHIELSVTASQTYLFINGILEASVGRATMYNSTSKALYCGYQQGQPVNNYFNGLITYARITKGVARHTTNFVPPKTLVPAR